MNTLNKEKRMGYNKKWFLTHKEENRKKSRDWNRKHPEKTRYYSIKRRSKELGMPFIMTRDEFSRWYLSRKQVCEYCDLVNFGICNHSRGKFVSFTIDRKDSNLPYSLENICFACWNCNRLKSDLFTYSEWKEIAQKYIKPKWMAAVNVNI